MHLIIYYSVLDVYFLSFLWFLIGKIDSVSKGDFIILIGGSLTHLMIWFLIFMNQDPYAIEHLWLVTTAMSILASFVLIEATTLIKILLAAVSILVALQLLCFGSRNSKVYNLLGSFTDHYFN